MAATSSNGTACLDSDDKIHFSTPDSFRDVAILLGGSAPKFYVNAVYMKTWSDRFRNALHSINAKDADKPERNLTPSHDSQIIDLTPVDTGACAGKSCLSTPSEVNLSPPPVAGTPSSNLSISVDDALMFLEVIHCQRIVRNIKDLLPLMRAAVWFGCTPLSQAICAVIVMKVRALKDADVDQRRRLMPLLFKILSHYKGEYLNGMYPAILAPCTRHDVETIINDRDYSKGENSDLPWLMLEHYVRAVQTSQNRAMELLGKQWDYDTLQHFLLLPKDRQTPEIIDHFELFFWIKLTDGTLQVNRNTLLSVSSVFRSMTNWQEDESEIASAVVGGSALSEENLIELPEDSITEFSPQLVLMLTPSVYGCLWRITHIDDFIREHYLSSASTEMVMSMFRLADKYNMIGLLSFYAEALMMDTTISLMDKVVLADSCYRVQFLDMCFEDTLELAQLIRDPEHEDDWRVVSPKTKERLMQRLADAVIRHESPSPIGRGEREERLDPAGSDGGIGSASLIVAAGGPGGNGVNGNSVAGLRGIPGLGARRRVITPLMSRANRCRVSRMATGNWESNDSRIRLLRNLQSRQPPTVGSIGGRSRARTAPLMPVQIEEGDADHEIDLDEDMPVPRVEDDDDSDDTASPDDAPSDQPRPVAPGAEPEPDEPTFSDVREGRQRCVGRDGSGLSD